jgi:hypothetical protein
MIFVIIPSIIHVFLSVREWYTWAGASAVHLPCEEDAAIARIPTLPGESGKMSCGGAIKP